MAMDYGAIVGAINDTLGGIAQTVVNHRFSDQSWKRQKKVLQNQIYWKTRDLKQSGLNPILAAGSALGGSAPGVHTPQAADFGGAGSRGLSAGGQASKVTPEVDALEAQADATRAQEDRTREGIRTEQAQQLAARAAAQASTANAENARIAAELARQELPKARAVAEAWNEPAYRETGKALAVTGGAPPWTTATAASAAGLKGAWNTILQGAKQSKNTGIGRSGPKAPGAKRPNRTRNRANQRRR